MAKWLKLKLATTNLIVAQVEFPFLREFISKCLLQLEFEVHEDIWSREALVWRILKHLPKLEDEYAILNNYIQGNLYKRFQLSSQLSSLLDEYMMYRPEWLERWEAGEKVELIDDAKNQVWQSELWRRLIDEDSKPFFKALILFLKAPEFVIEKISLPKVISLFGITNMPLLFLRFFQKFSEAIDEFEIDFYYSTPCREYWADLRLEQTHFYRNSQDVVPDFGVNKHKLQPYQLLKSWGLLGRDFLNALIENTDFDGEELFQENRNQSQLASLQNGILNLKSISGNKLKQDGSISVHACYGPMRELQELQNYIKAIFKQSSEIRAHEIVVICPNIDKYSSYIKAVFEEAEDHGKQNLIPFTISDKSFKSHSKLVESFFKICRLSKSRLSNQDLLEILKCREVSERFSLHQQDLELIYKWIEKAEIRWGQNAEFRERMIGLKGFDQNSWEFGLNRLMAGYAYAEEVMYQDHLSVPLDHDGIIFGKFKRFTDEIFKVLEVIRIDQKCSDWITILEKILDVFIMENDHTTEERGLLSHSIQKLKSCWNASLFDERLSNEIVINALSRFMDQISSSHGFLNRGVTFCEMLPMRSIPAKVVCVLGLNDGEFPRRDFSPSFDLMQKNWKQGDRSLRLDDRYIFIESVLSAKKYLYFSYNGFDVKDNSIQQPSILLTELIDFLSEAGSGFKVVQHAMHPYSLRYFNGDLKSFSKRNYHSAIAVHSDRQSKALLCSSELPLLEKDSDYHEIELKDMVSFFKHPARHFLKQRLGTRYPQEEVAELQEEESFDKPIGLNLYHLYEDLHSKIYRELKRGRDLSKKELLAFCIASGQFPYGHFGEKLLKEIIEKMYVYSHVMIEVESNQEESQILFELKFDDMKVILHCDTGRVFDNTYFPYHFGKAKIKHRLSELLPLLTLKLNGSVISFREQFMDCSYQISQLDEGHAKSDLKELISLYLSGLRKPLAFIPNCFESYQEKIKGKHPEEDKRKAYEAARRQWSFKNERISLPADCEDEVYNMCFSDVFPGDHPDFSLDFWSTIEKVSHIFTHYNWVKLK